MLEMQILDKVELTARLFTGATPLQQVAPYFVRYPKEVGVEACLQNLRCGVRAINLARRRCRCGLIASAISFTYSVFARANRVRQPSAMRFGFGHGCAAPSIETRTATEDNTASKQRFHRFALRRNPRIENAESQN
jgi:hypothetical protein